MRRLILILSLVLIASQKSYSASAGSVIGNVDGLIYENGIPYVYGWACVIGLREAIPVHLYLDGSASTNGTFLTGSPTNLSNEAGISQACQTSGIKHRFKISVAPYLGSALTGRSIFVHGINRVGSNGLLSGSAHIPGQLRLYVDDYVSPSARSTDARPGIQNALNAALALSKKNNKSVNIEFGPYSYILDCKNYEPKVDPVTCTVAPTDVAKSCLTISDVSGIKGKLVLTGHRQGASKIISKQPFSGLLEASELEILSINNLTIDRQNLPFTQGTITEVDAGSVVFNTQSGYPEFSNEACNCMNKKSVSVALWGMVFDGTTKLPRKDKEQKPGFIYQSKACMRLSTTTTRLFPVDENGLSDTQYFRKGDIYAQVLNGGFRSSAIYANGNNYIYIKALKINSAAGMGMLLTNNNKRIVVADSSVDIPENSDRMISTISDAMHIQHNRAQLQIVLNHFARMGDDGINTYSIPADIVGVGSSSSLWVHAVRDFRIGDLVQVYSTADGHIKGYSKVAAVVTSASIPYIRLDLTAPVPQVVSGDVIASVSAATPNSIIKGNYFGFHRGRDITFRAAGAVIADNVFNNINWSGIYMGFDTGKYKEGPIPYQNIIKNNQFLGGDLSYSAPLMIGGNTTTGVLNGGPYSISIENNSFCGYMSPDAIDIKGTGTNIQQINNYENRSACPAVSYIRH